MLRKRNTKLYEFEDHRFSMLLDLSQLDSDQTSCLLKEYPEAIKLDHPSDHVEAVLPLLGKYFPLFKKPFPFQMGVSEYTALLQKCMDTYVGEEVLASLYYSKPQEGSKGCYSVKDLAEVVDKLLVQQGQRLLAYVFDTANPKGKLYYTTRSSPIHPYIFDTVSVIPNTLFSYKEKKGTQIAIVDKEAITARIEAGYRRTEALNKANEDKKYLFM